MRTYQTLLFYTAFGLIGIFGITTLFIVGDAPLLDGPQDEANRAMGIVVRNAAISLGLIAALSVIRRRTQQRVAGKPREEGGTRLD